MLDFGRYLDKKWKIIKNIYMEINKKSERFFHENVSS